MNDDKKSGGKKLPERVRFVYDKARHHRTFHADGAWATATPQGEVQFTFFNDLRPMPEWTISAVTPEGQVGQEISRKLNVQEISREANVTVVMNRATVNNLIDLLSDILKRLEGHEAAEAAVPAKANDQESKVS